MLTDQPFPDRQLHGAERSYTHRPRALSALSDRLASVVAFAGAVALILTYALRGGSYDSVAFQEHGLVIWWIVAVGIALGLLPMSRPSRPALLFVGALTAYAGWTALSLLWTQSSELTTEELARTLGYIGLVVLILLALDRKTWRSAVIGLGFGALLVCALAVGVRLGAFGKDYLSATFGTDRLSYPFNYWNAVAACGAMSIAFGLAWSAHDRSPVRRAVALALVPVAVLATYLSFSRAGVAGVALAVLAVIALSRNRLTALVHAVVAAAGGALAIIAVRGSSQIERATGHQGAATVVGALIFAATGCAGVSLVTRAVRIDDWRMPRRLFRPLAIVGGSLALVVGAALGPHLVSHAWHSFTRTPAAASTPDPATRLQSLSSTRYPLWKSSLKAFEAHPVGGTGAGTLEFWWNEHATNSEFVRDAHNIWLENMAELGAPGLLLIIAVTASAIAVCVSVRRRARRSASAGAAVACLSVFIVYLLQASVDWMWESTAITVLALALVAALSVRLSKGKVRLSLPWRAALALAAVGAGALQLPGLVSTAELHRSQAAEKAGNAQLALSWARDAVGAEPWSASAYEQRGLVLESVGQLDQAAQDLRRAVAHEPTNYVHWLLLARVQAERGKLDQARRDYQRAHELRPRAAVFAFAPYFRTR